MLTSKYDKLSSLVCLFLRVMTVVPGFSTWVIREVISSNPDTVTSDVFKL